MNLAHVHLLLNHFPTVAFGVGVGLLIGGIFVKSDELKRASLVILFMTSALTIAVYVSGNDAQAAIRDRADVSAAAMNRHESAALVAFTFMQLTGLAAWLGLWKWRRTSDSGAATRNMTVVLLLSMVTFGVMARAANLGGQIRHSEIQAAQDSSGAEPEPGIARSLAAYVGTHQWVWPLCETLHFIGLSLLLGVVLTVDLRMLGVGKTLSFAALYQLLPLGMLGFTINLVTGMIFFVATPDQYTGFLFFLKMILVVLGAANVLYFMLFDQPWTIGEGDDAPTATKVIAASAIVIWIGVLCCGRLLPFFGNSF
jgi:uncharacterized membrane protein